MTYPENGSIGDLSRPRRIATDLDAMTGATQAFLSTAGLFGLISCDFRALDC
jgi:hypothetical protein